MNWGKWIIAAFVLFALFIGVLVTVCVKQDISLVSNSYYKDELAYQQQIERIRNTAGLDQKPAISIVRHELEISLSHFNSIENGELKLFRPSDSRYDRSFKLKETLEDIQSIDVSALPKGMYKARLNWQMGGKEFFFEKIINL